MPSNKPREYPDQFTAWKKKADEMVFSVDPDDEMAIFCLTEGYGRFEFCRDTAKDVNKFISRMIKHGANHE